MGSWLLIWKALNHSVVLGSLRRVMEVDDPSLLKNKFGQYFNFNSTQYNRKHNLQI